jgi:hypothetical protein
LLDEPLTGLDRDLHNELAAQLRDVLTTAGITSLLVTHDHDEARITGDDYFDDGVMCELAERLGRPVNTSVPADVTYGNAMLFSPSALRENAREVIGIGAYDLFPDTKDALLWVAGIATDEELQETGSWILSDDDLWETYNLSFMEGIREAHDRFKGRGVK